MSFPVTDPWEHLLAIGLGAGFGNAVANWEVRLQEDLDKKLSEVQSANNKRYIGKNASHCVISLQPLTLAGHPSVHTNCTIKGIGIMSALNATTP